jgi:hypothetical protein
MVLRVAALPVETLDALKDTTLTTLLRHWLQAEARIHRERDAISSALFESIGEQQAPEGRRILLRLRRSLYNTRTVRGPDLDAASQFLAPDVLDLVHQAVARIEAHQDARRSLAIMHDEGLVAARRHVHQKILTPSFLHGLALSSRTLYRNVARYGDPASSRGARFEQVERGLLRYLSRASRKATPYARFCSVIGGTFDDPDECRAGSEAWSTFDGDPTAQRGYLRIDKKLFARLWAHLKSVNGVRGALVVALNSTLRRNGDSWTFLAAPAGKEQFQRLDRSEALDVVELVVRTSPGISLQRLRAQLTLDASIDATADEISRFTDALIGIGFLLLRSPVEDQVADWDRPLVDFLASIDDSAATLVRDLLVEVRSLVDRCERAEPDERVHSFDRITGIVTTSLQSLGIDSSDLRQCPVYEDASADARWRVQLSTDLSKTLSAAAALISLTQRVAQPRTAQATMRAFFEKEFGTRHSVPLLEFYETYYRHHLKSHLALEQRRHDDAVPAGYDFGNPLKVPLVSDAHAAMGKLRALFQQKWAEAPEAVEILVDADEVAQALAQVTPTTPCPSVTVFGQLLPSSLGTPSRLVMPRGQYYPGFGRFFSRFLYIIPREFHERQLEANATLHGACLAEITGDGNFNANLHPRLLPSEIVYPTSEHAVDAGQMKCDDLVVVRADDDATSLVLRHEALNTRVIPIDLGFQAGRLRPPLYQLLTSFTPPSSFGWLLPETNHSPEPRLTSAPADPERQIRVIYRPRFVFADRIVLARKRWTVPSPLLPRQSRSEENGAFFLRLNQWRVSHGIPERVFMRVQPVAAMTPGSAIKPSDVPTAKTPSSGSPLSATHDQKDNATAPTDDEGPVVLPGSQDAVKGPIVSARRSRDWRKPQYIDFESPLLVRLLASVPNVLLHFTMYFEEVYPPDDALPSFRGDHFATEAVFQLTFPVSVSDVPRVALEHAVGV